MNIKVGWALVAIAICFIQVNIVSGQYSYPELTGSAFSGSPGSLDYIDLLNSFAGGLSGGPGGLSGGSGAPGGLSGGPGAPGSLSGGPGVPGSLSGSPGGPSVSQPSGGGNPPPPPPPPPPSLFTTQG
ncbi:hypothetical protein CHUAL_014064 [Chamberlinius hualienensis]